MPGSNYTGSAYSTLSQLLGTPMAGPYSAGFDQLASGYNSAKDTGMADVARRGLTQSGATPELFTSLGEDYAKGAGSIVSAGQQAQNAQIQQILSSLLGLGSPATARAGADISQRETDIGAGADLATGLFGDVKPSIFNPTGSRGLISQGLWGNPQAFLSKLVGII